MNIQKVLQDPQMKAATEMEIILPSPRVTLRLVSPCVSPVSESNMNAMKEGLGTLRQA